MPNIEIYGTLDLGTAQRWQKGIFKRTKNLPFADEIISSIFLSKCKNRHGKNNPFIRIVVEKNEEEKAKQILEQLNSWAGGGGLQFDIEVATIEKFYERGKGDWKPF